MKNIIKKNCFIMLMAIMVFALGACSHSQVDRVLVKKSQNKMYLLKYGEIIRSYNIGLGGNPVGHKIQQGDMKTPEGHYELIYKNPNSKFYKSIKISYPNDEDIARAKLMGVDPGGDIVIHGFPNELGNYMGPVNPPNWTQGCIAVRNHEMDEIWRMVDVDTPIDIEP